MQVKKIVGKTRDEMADMLVKAQALSLKWEDYFLNNKLSTKENAKAIRNYTALRGVVKTLRWTLGQLGDGESPLL
tara:strand:+ start:2741 stop:2965 length:225 start_codon:yes stop_codon:yes gene_type:complete